MSRVCSVCSHTERQTIDLALVNGEANLRIATTYGLTETAVRRHRSMHLPKALLKAADVEELVRADDLLGQLRDLQTRTYRILAQAEDARDLRTALAAIGAARANLALLTEMLTVGTVLAQRQLSGEVLLEAIDVELARLRGGGNERS